MEMVTDHGHQKKWKLLQTDMITGLYGIGHWSQTHMKMVTGRYGDVHTQDGNVQR